MLIRLPVETDEGLGIVVESIAKNETASSSTGTGNIIDAPTVIFYPNINGIL